MPKSHGRLWPDVVSWARLCRAYARCRRRKRFKRGAVQFDFAWETNLLQLQRELIDGVYMPGAYRNFEIHEPKTRKISAAPFRDRIVHHAIVRVLEPIYEKRFIYDSYACRRVKGTHRAIDRAQAFLRQHPFYLKTDIVRFFPNVDHQVLLSVLDRSIRDSSLLDLIRKIVDSGRDVLRDEATPSYFPGDDLFATLRPTGLPIGNLTSQFFANVLLDPIDHFIKEDLRIPGYVRYADDLVLFGSNKEELWETLHALGRRLEAMRLRLHTGKTQIRPSTSRLQFLGMILTRDDRRLCQDAIKRFNRRRRRLQHDFAKGAIATEDIRKSIAAWTAYANHANSRGIRKQLFRRLSFRRDSGRP